MSPRALLCSLVLAAGTTCCLAFTQELTENPGTPEYFLVANHIADTIKKHIEDKLTPITAEIEQVKATMLSKCSRASEADTTASPPVVVDHTTKLQEIELKLDEALQKTEALEGILQEKFDGLVTSHEIVSLERKLSAEILGGSERVENLLLTGSQMEDIVRTETGKLKESCGSDERLTALANAVMEVKETLEELQGEAVGIKNNVEQCNSQNVLGEVREVKNVVQAVMREVQTLATDSRNFSSALEEVWNTIQVLASTPPPPQEDEEQEQELPTGPTYPCLDSDFPRTDNLKVCQTAAQFNRCRLPLVSYHCCDTCTSRGLLPEMGPWRYMNLTREVRPIQVISVFAP